MLLLFGLVYTESYRMQQQIAPEKKWYFGFDSGKNLNIKLISWYQSQKW